MEIYRNFTRQTDFVVQYLGVARQYEHHTRVQVPKLKHAPVNLGRQLEDHLVDLLIDVAASGENVVEREGLSVRHPARFVLVGSGNPEEGELRPQLLDRFGLSVEVRTPEDIATRITIIRRRDRFDRDPAAFAAEWREADAVQQAPLLLCRGHRECVRSAYRNDIIIRDMRIHANHERETANRENEEAQTTLTNVHS